MIRSRTFVVPRRSSTLQLAATAAVACLVCAGSALAAATPAAAGPQVRGAVTSTGGLDPDTAQHAAAMLPAGSPDAAASSAASSARTAHRASSLQAWNGSDLNGVDVASYQHPNNAGINWGAVAGSGVTFAFVKATESTGYTNPYYAQDVRGARAAGLQVGAYHFARPAYSATAQADAFAGAIATATPTLAPVLDLEDNGGLGVSDLQSWVSAFLSRTESDTGVRPIIYTGPSFWSSSMGGSGAFTRYPLWVAHYTSAAAPYSVGGWGAWTFWQWSDGSVPASSAVPGISGDVDHDRFAGTSADLAVLAAGNAAYWVRAAGISILGRSFSSSDVAAFAQPITAGAASEQSTAWEILASTEALSHDVLTDYQSLLGRGAAPAETQGWVSARQRQLGKTGEIVGFVGSPEFYANAGGTDPGFVAALYSKVLGRNAAPQEIVYWTTAIEGNGRQYATNAIVGSTEAARRLEDGAYLHVLGRHGDSGGLANSPTSFPGALAYETYQASMYASSEYNRNRVG